VVAPHRGEFIVLAAHSQIQYQSSHQCDVLRGKQGGEGVREGEREVQVQEIVEGAWHTRRKRAASWVDACICI
jgi:hypothetical protein